MFDAVHIDLAIVLHLVVFHVLDRDLAVSVHVVVGKSLNYGDEVVDLCII
jgi:hypothetical protein